MVVTDNSQHYQQDSLNQSGIVRGFPPAPQGNMSCDNIDVSPAKIECISQWKFSALLVR